MQTMRIAMYTDSFYPFIGGVSTAIFNLSQILAQQGHEIFIQSPRYPTEANLKGLPSNVQVHYVNSMKVYMYPDFRIGTGLPLSLKAIREFDPDVIHIHTPLSIGIEGTLIAKALRVPTVHTFHTYFMDEDALRLVGFNNKHILPLIKQGGWRFNAAFCNRFNSIIAPSEAVAKDLLSHGVNKPVYVAPNMLDVSIYCPKKGRKKKLTKLLFVGRLSIEKRVDLTIRTLATLLEQDPDYELILIGDGPDRNALFDLSVKLGVASHITWYGAIEHQKLIHNHIFHEGDVFIVSSKFETQGLSTLEAMAHGLPVIAVSSETNKEVIGKGGISVKDTGDADKTVQLLAKAVLKMNSQSDVPYPQLAYQEALKYSPDALLDTYQTIYQKTKDSE